MCHSRRIFTLAAIVVLCGMMTALAGDGATMKCADAKCDYKQMIVIGGGRIFESATGYCHSCRKFQQITWSRPGAPKLPNVNLTPPPKPLAEVWNPSLGETRNVYKCPGCEGAFMEIRDHSELTHCPNCSKAGFAIDPNGPRLGVD